MNKRKRVQKAGLTGLETAIVLIAFIITAAAFAFGVLNLGLQVSQKSTDVIRAGLIEASSALEIDGGVIVKGEVNKPHNITFAIKLAAGKEPVTIDSNTVITYIDPYKAVINVYHATDIDKVVGDDDDLLEPGEKWSFTVDLTHSLIYNGADNVQLKPLDKFRIELKPTTGAVLTIERTLPAAIDEVTYLG